MNVEAALEEELKENVIIDLDMLFTARKNNKEMDIKKLKKIRSFIEEGLVLIMNLYYKRESWITGETIYRMLRFRLRQNLSMTINKMPREEDMHKIEDIGVNLNEVKDRYKQLSYEEKRKLEDTNMVFYTRMAGGSISGGEYRLVEPDRMQKTGEETQAKE